MADFKKGQKVIVTHARLGTVQRIAGTVTGIKGTSKGPWVRVCPDDKPGTERLARPAHVSAV